MALLYDTTFYPATRQDLDGLIRHYERLAENPFNRERSTCKQFANLFKELKRYRDEDPKTVPPRT